MRLHYITSLQIGACLVARLGPEDSTYENWDDMQQAYNLEDKVILPAGGVDSNNTTRANRPRKPPTTHFNDYV